ncbi:MAG: DUF4258 domain-containing protein [Phycisphaeraceae bacterium]
MELSGAILTDHARKQLHDRGIEAPWVMGILAAPQRVAPVRPGRVVAQGMIDSDHLLRVFVDVDRVPPEVVTAYITSQLTKYRSQP